MSKGSLILKGMTNENNQDTSNILLLNNNEKTHYVVEKNMEAIIGNSSKPVCGDDLALNNLFKIYCNLLYDDCEVRSLVNTTYNKYKYNKVNYSY